MPKIRPVLLLLALAACLGAVAGCGDDVEQSAADRSAQQAEEELAKQPAAEEPAEPVQAEEGGAGRRRGRPVDEAQDRQAHGRPAEGLVAQDLIVGKGAEAKSGAQVSVQYVGNTFKANKEVRRLLGRRQGGRPVPVGSARATSSRAGTAASSA